MTQAKYRERGVAENGVPIVTQRGIGSLVKRRSTLKTRTGPKTYSRYWIYLPTDVAEDKAFPFKPGDKLLISITEGRKVFLEKA